VRGEEQAQGESGDGGQDQAVAVGGGPGVLEELKEDPGQLGLETLLREIGKLRRVRTLGLAGLRTEELPRLVAITALASASSCLLAPLYFVAEPLAWFIPAGRFPGLIVSGIAGVQLARGGQSGP